MLLADEAYERVVVLARREPGVAYSPKLELHLIDFEKLEGHESHMRVDHVFCALGTTMRKAGSRERFRRVDFDYPYRISQLTRANGAEHLSLVSALSADPGSRIFYSRVKGELEEAVRELGFPSLSVLRPSLLLGSRTEFRLGEQIAGIFSFLAPPRYRGIQAEHVAKVMLDQAKRRRPGFQVLVSREIKRLARVAE